MSELSKCKLCRSEPVRVNAETVYHPAADCFMSTMVIAESEWRTLMSTAEPVAVPVGHTYLPIITPDLWDQFNDSCLMTWKDGPHWTQTAVDFCAAIPTKQQTVNVLRDAIEKTVWERLDSVADRLEPSSQLCTDLRRAAYAMKKIDETQKSDSERLDWIGRNPDFECCIVVDRPNDGKYEVKTDKITAYGENFREAIDVAMGK